jgi:butyryl-CoA dehydrogenase
MDWMLNEDQSMLRDMVRKWAKDRLLPRAAELDREHKYPEDLVKEMGEMGLMGVPYAEDLGGSGFDALSYAIVIEELSAACAGTGVICSAHTSLCCEPIYKFGTDEQKKKFLFPLLQGEKLGCFCLSEPGTGSDAAAQKTTAVKDGNDWIINGTKNFITNGPQADTHIVIAMTDKSKGNHGITAFIVTSDAEGFEVGSLEDKMGINASGTSQMIYEDVRVPDSQRLGDVGKGFKVAMVTLDGGRIGIASQALGIARVALEEAVQYTTERSAFGSKVSDFQGIQWMIADMINKIDASRALIWRAAKIKDLGQNYSMAAAQAKLFASETAMEITTKCVQLYGGYGYSREYPAERHMRDAKITEIYEGTSEIMRLVIARGYINKFI